MKNQYDNNYKLNIITRIQDKFPDITINSEYISSRKKLTLECYEHGVFEQTPELLLKTTTYNRLNANHSGCQSCAQIKIIQGLLKEYNSKYGFDYIYPTDLVILKDELFSAECPRHGEFKTSLKVLKNGTKCLKCSQENITFLQTDTQNSFIKKAKHLHPYYDYAKVLYKSSRENITVICQKHKEFTITPNHLLMGRGCQKCSNGCTVSKGELEVLEGISTSEIVHSDRKILNGKELDIYIPNKNTAIEYNGLMFHSQGKENGKINNTPKNYHLDKTTLCEDQGIQLFHIFENEWKTKKEIWQSVLNNKISSELTTRVFARKCEIKEVSASEAREFENSNHLQGAGLSSIRYGLYYDDMLVSLMTFGKSRMSKKYQYELIRFCSKLNTVVVGGASKLLKHFERKNAPQSLVSYANRRWSQGDLYLNLGFNLSHISGPNYFYFKSNSDKLYSRNKFQKHKLKELLDIFDDSLSEWENMKNNNYRRIYDSGNFVFFKEY